MRKKSIFHSLCYVLLNVRPLCAIRMLTFNAKKICVYSELLINQKVNKNKFTSICNCFTVVYFWSNNNGICQKRKIRVRKPSLIISYSYNFFAHGKHIHDELVKDLFEIKSCHLFTEFLLPKVWSVAQHHQNNPYLWRMQSPLPPRIHWLKNLHFDICRFNSPSKSYIF